MSEAMRLAIMLAVLMTPALAHAEDGPAGGVGGGTATGARVSESGIAGGDSNVGEKAGNANSPGIGIKSAGDPYKKDGSFDPAGRTDPASSSDPATQPKIEMPH